MTQKIVKRKQSRKPHICGILVVRASRLCQESEGSLRRRSFSCFLFYCFLLSNAKGLPIKEFPEVTLVSLSLRARTFLKLF